MHEDDKAVIIDRYHGRLERYGPVPEALGWLKGRQNFRFHFLAQIEGFLPDDSLLDVGCAFGDLWRFMSSRGWMGDYLGVDIVPGLIDKGKERYPHLDLRVMDIQKARPETTFDWVFCSGALTSKTAEGDEYAHFESMLRIMFDLCRKGVAVNLLSPYVDFDTDVNFHPNLGRMVDTVAAITRRFAVRHDYMPYEFTAYLYKDAEISRDANVFAAHYDIYEQIKT